MSLARLESSVMVGGILSIGPDQRAPILRSAMSSSDGEREEDAFDFEGAPSGGGSTRSPTCWLGPRSTCGG